MYITILLLLLLLIIIILTIIKQVSIMIIHIILINIIADVLSGYVVRLAQRQELPPGLRVHHRAGGAQHHL